MLVLVNALVLFSAIQVVAFPCDYEHDGFVFDLSILRNNTADYHVATGVLGIEYWLNMCDDVLVAMCGAGCAACQTWNNGAVSGEACLGRTDTAQFLPPDRDNSAFRLTFTNGDRFPENSPRSFEIDFYCDVAAGKGTPTFIEEFPMLNYQFIWNTSYACQARQSDVGANVSLVFASPGQFGLVGGRSGESLSFLVQLVDPFGQNITNDTIAAGVQLTTVVDNDLPTEQQFPGGATYNGFGLFTVSYRYGGPHGVHNLTVRVWGVEVFGAWYAITITPGPAFSGTSSVTFASTSAFVDTVQTLAIDLRDFSGAIIAEQNPENSFALILLGPVVVRPTVMYSAQPTGNESYWSGFFSASVPALYTVNFTVNNGAALSNSAIIRINSTSKNGSYPTTFEVDDYIYDLSGFRNVTADYAMKLQFYDVFTNFGGSLVSSLCGDDCAMCLFHPGSQEAFCYARSSTILVSSPAIPGNDGKGLSAWFGDYPPVVGRSVRMDLICDWSAGQRGPASIALDTVLVIVTWPSTNACPIGENYVQANASLVFEAIGQKGLTGGRSGEVLSFTVQLVDKSGHNVTNDTVASRASVTVKLSSAGLDAEQLFEGSYLGQGLFTVSYQYIGPVGPVNVAVFVLGSEDVGSPYVVNFATGPATASQSLAVFPADSAVAGSNQEFYVILADFSGNYITSDLAENVISVVLRGPLIVVTQVLFVETSPFNNSHFVGSYKIDIAGDYVVDVEVNGEAAQSLPAIVTIMPTNAPLLNSTIVFGSGLSDAIAGEAEHVVIQLRDEFGNNITQNISLPWSATLKGPTTGADDEVQPVFTTDGAWTITYNRTKAGTYSLTVAINGTGIPRSPFAITLFPGPADPAACTASGGGLTDAEAHEPATFIVTSKDRWGNLRTNDNFTVWIVDGGDRLQNTPTLKNNLDGTYSGTYEVFVEGAYWLNIQIGGQDISGSPFEIKCDSDASDVPPNIFDKLSTGELVGIVVGCLAFTSVLTVVGFVVVYRLCISRKKDYDKIAM